MYDTRRRLYGAVIVLLLIFPLLAHQPAPPLSAATGLLTATPPALAATVAPGQRATQPLVITNVTGDTLSYRLYEAYPASAGATRLAALPAELQRVALPVQERRVDPQIAQELTEASDGQTTFLVFLADQADLTHAYAIEDWDERGRFVYETLKGHAARTQADLRAWLELRGLEYTPLWIANALAVRGGATDVQALEGRAEVAMLRASYTARLDGSPAVALAQVSGCDSSGCWNIRKIGADRVWSDFGVTGEQIVVASIDSGAVYSHPALLPRYRGYSATGQISHVYNWFDPIRALQAPVDLVSHGTHVMGTMVAGGTPAVGVAPGARWIAARACEISTCDDINLIRAAQWMLAPTDLSGNNPRPDLRPHIINNSWAEPDGNNLWYAGYTAAWRAAGIFPVFAAGNSLGTASCTSIASPADYNDVVGVGATDSNDQIASFSKRGPTSDGRLKPDLSAPGRDIPSTLPGNRYGLSSGTSMAAPHVAGAIALLWSANPALIGNYEATYEALTSSAYARPDASCGSQISSGSHLANQVYGHGRLDTYAAVARARIDLPWLRLERIMGSLNAAGSQTITVTFDATQVPGPGTYTARILVHSENLTSQPLVIPVTLTVPESPAQIVINGTITDGLSGHALAGSVAVTGGPGVMAGADGRFSITLPVRPEPYSLSAVATGYLSQTLEVRGTDVAILTPGFQLRPAEARLMLTTSLIEDVLGFGRAISRTIILENRGTFPLTYKINARIEPYRVRRSNEVNGPSFIWRTMPENASRVSLANDDASSLIPLGFPFPFYGGSYERVAISANGWLSFTTLSSQRFLNACLPVPQGQGGAIVPLWADLDPSLGGSISYATVAEGFLVEFAEVPRADAPDERFSFQVLLGREGQITYSYRQVGSLAGITTLGVQGGVAKLQSLGCSRDVAPQNNLTIVLQPQSQTSAWLTADQLVRYVPPGSTASFNIGLNWATSPDNQALEGAILIDSNDPSRPVVRLPVRLSTQQAPYTIVLFPIWR